MYCAYIEQLCAHVFPACVVVVLCPCHYCREDVDDIMHGRPDGSFLVRDSARVPGEYTLTLK